MIALPEQKIILKILGNKAADINNTWEADL